MLFGLVGSTLRAGIKGASIYLFGRNAVAASCQGGQLSPPNLGQVERLEFCGDHESGWRYARYGAADSTQIGVSG